MSVYCLLYHADSFTHGADNDSRAISLADLGMDIPLASRRLLPIGVLCLKPDEEPFRAYNDVRQPCHHMLAAVDLEAEPTLAP